MPGRYGGVDGTTVAVLSGSDFCRSGCPDTDDKNWGVGGWAGAVALVAKQAAASRACWGNRWGCWRMFVCMLK